MITIRNFAHLLPTGRAWKLTVGKCLREFFEGLVPDLDAIRQAADDTFDDLYPQTTRNVDEWEEQFGLSTTGGSLTEQERRDRLAAAWSSLGGQSPSYIKQVLQDNGFAVYVHEWWEPGTNPPVARDPTAILRTNSDDAPPPIGYPLVNKITQTRFSGSISCGDPVAQCGNPTVQCGQFSSIDYPNKRYTVPTDSTKWPYFLYIGGQTFPNTVQLPSARKDEFEDLCLKICPCQQWLGILVEWV